MERATPSHPSSTGTHNRDALPASQDNTDRVTHAVQLRIQQTRQTNSSRSGRRLPATDPKQLRQRAKNYYHGINGCTKNIELSLLFFDRAVKAGSVKAQAELGEILLRGLEGATIKKDEGYQLLRAAAAKGYAGAQTKLGNTLFFGHYGLSQDIEGGKALLEKAAKQGDRLAKRVLRNVKRKEEIRVKPDSTLRETPPQMTRTEKRNPSGKQPAVSKTNPRSSQCSSSTTPPRNRSQCDSPLATYEQAISASSGSEERLRKIGFAFLLLAAEQGDLLAKTSYQTVADGFAGDVDIDISLTLLERILTKEASSKKQLAKEALATIQAWNIPKPCSKRPPLQNLITNVQKTQQGDLTAQFKLGCLFMIHPIPVWYRTRCEKQHLEAQVARVDKNAMRDLGRLLLNGDWCGMDDKARGSELLNQAATERVPKGRRRRRNR